ncbi:outer membrane beta-barrel protein [Terasakiella sp. SH-1]|uniref:outer membrane protein n=1 Tax=Terasakiella sp. SH-1 TaxID=2560057 RepID=UPI001F0D52BB|nr:outer membrane beta-barrel protein [Terasakiella sp. SH-1]
MKKVCSVAVGLALLGAANAHAADLATPVYVKAGVGYVNFTDQRAEATRGMNPVPDIMTTDFTDTQAVALGVGYSVTDSIDLEATYQYNLASKSNAMSWTQGGALEAGHYNVTVQTSSLMLNALVKLNSLTNEAKTIRPYVGLGVGVAAHRISDLETVGTYYDYRVNDKANYSLAGRATLGAVYDISEKVSLDLSYSLAHYGVAKGDKIWHEVGGTSQGPVETPMAFDVLNHEALFSLRYNF